MLLYVLIQQHGSTGWTGSPAILNAPFLTQSLSTSRLGTDAPLQETSQAHVSSPSVPGQAGGHLSMWPNPPLERCSGSS